MFPVAAHLDSIKAAVPSMCLALENASRVQSSGSNVEHAIQVAYTKRRVGEIEENIRQALEEVAEAKCELLLG